MDNTDLGEPEIDLDTNSASYFQKNTQLSVKLSCTHPPTDYMFQRIDGKNKRGKCENACLQEL